ncbi:hypothetical protein RNI52_30640 [Labrys neptuniae]|uniref:DUF6911 family protein n=1 Tax=Labrys neptuniae TaxID=376174 RepID=UPI0028907AD6|nr:hypothetical protein [Labrys neptuniae]MDT3381722.1 hypothetical protein [Labrys neptuniae]
MNKNDFFVSWFIRDVPRPEGGGGQANCDWDLILSKLQALRHADGSVNLVYDNGEESDYKSLSVHAQNDHYFIVFHDKKNEEDVRRASFDSNIPYGKYEMQGYTWDSRTIFTDYELAYDTFKQFFETKNITSSRIAPY